MNQYYELFKRFAIIILLTMSIPTKPINDETIDDIIAKHKIDLNVLKKYYLNLQAIAHYIFDMIHQPGYVDLNDQLSDGIIPERVQVEANGGVALEVYHGLPRGLWTPLGFLPINEGGFISDKVKLATIMELLTGKLMLTKVPGSVIKSHGSESYVCSVGQNLTLERFPLFQPVPVEKMIVPYDAYLLWSEVKPIERSIC